LPCISKKNFNKYAHSLTEDNKSFIRWRQAKINVKNLFHVFVKEHMKVTSKSIKKII